MYQLFNLTMMDNTVYSRPPNTAPSNTAPLLTASFFLVIYDSLNRRFPIPCFFCQSLRAAVLGSRLYQQELLLFSPLLYNHSVTPLRTPMLHVHLESIRVITTLLSAQLYHTAPASDSHYFQQIMTGRCSENAPGFISALLNK